MGLEPQRTSILSPLERFAKRSLIGWCEPLFGKAKTLLAAEIGVKDLALREREDGRRVGTLHLLLTVAHRDSSDFQAECCRMGAGSPTIKKAIFPPAFSRSHIKASSSKPVLPRRLKIYFRRRPPSLSRKKAKPTACNYSTS